MMEYLIYLGALIAWVGCGLFGSWLGWKEFCDNYGPEPFWRPFYVIMAVSFGVLNIPCALLGTWKGKNIFK